MNKYIIYGLFFISGCAFGSLAYAKYAEKKYLDQTTFVMNNSVKEDEKNEDTDAIICCDDVGINFSYSDYSEYKSNDDLDSSRKDFIDYSRHVSTYNPENNIVVISPMDYGECGYTMISMTYFEGDDVLADDAGCIVDDWENIVGDFKSHFGEYESDSVFMRNHKTKTDYEILADIRNYYDIHERGE